jgi:uncharacterized protein (TIGR03032 family)
LTNLAPDDQKDRQQGSDDLELIASDGLAEWLHQAEVSLVFGTPPAKLWLLGLDGRGEISIFDRSLDKVMGLAHDGAHRLWIATRFEIWRFENALPQGQVTDDGHDRLFVPRAVYPVGDVNIHDLCIEADGRDLWVNTRFGCLASTSETTNFVPRWSPPFLDGVHPGDRCHLNGLAMRDGVATWVTCVSQSTEVDGWRDGRRDQGVVIDVQSGDVVASGLSMPHSPRWYNGQLWVANAGTGEVGVIDFAAGKFEPVAFIPGFARGMCHIGKYAVVGSSKPRRTGIYSGLELDEALERRNLRPHLGIFILDLEAGELVHWLLIEGDVLELFDVCALPGARQPAAIGLLTDEIQRELWFDDAIPSAALFGQR